MKPTEFMLTANLQGVDKPSALRILMQLEKEGYELVKRGELPSWVVPDSYRQDLSRGLPLTEAAMRQSTTQLYRVESKRAEL